MPRALIFLDQFLYLVNQARVGFIKLKYLLEYETQLRLRYRAPQQIHGTLKRMTTSSSNHARACMFPGGVADQYQA